VKAALEVGAEFARLNIDEAALLSEKL
jgi:hypothetical protein